METIVFESQIAEGWEEREGERERAAKGVKPQIEGLQVRGEIANPGREGAAERGIAAQDKTRETGEAEEGGREGAVEVIVREIEGGERRERSEAGGERGREVIAGQNEGGERREEAEARVKGAGQGEGGEVDGDDAVGEGVAGEAGPGGAVGIGREPGGEGEGGVMEP